MGQVLTAYEENLREQFLPVSDYERYLAHGQKVLQKLFGDLDYKLPTGSLSEQSFRDIRVGPAHLSGAMDRIDQAENSLVIVDYKTGKPLSSFDTKDKNKQVKAWKHRTQLIFYSLLI